MQAEEALAPAPRTRDEELAIRKAELALRERELEEARPAKLLKLAAEARSLLTDMGMFSVTEQLAVKGLVGRAICLPQQGGLLSLPAPEEAEKYYTVAEWMENEAHRHFNPKQLKNLGREVAAQFRTETVPSRDPDTKPQEVGGRLVQVKAYSNKPVRRGGPTGWKIIEEIARRLDLLD